MATAKKPAAKKPAAKKTAAVKKPAAKKAPAKKPAAKKPAVKKAAPVKKAATAKKPAAKKAATKTAAVKKPTTAKAPAVKKPAAKTPAVKAAAKPAVKAPVKKPVAKPAVKAAVTKAAVTKVTATKVATTKVATTKVAKPAVKAAATKIVAEKPAAKPVEVPEANVKLRNLFEAFSQGKLPFANGYIISSFFSETTAYSIYEIVSYAGVKEIHQTSDGLQFVSGGKKLHVLLENDTYQNKFIEPVSRVAGESIPKRFSELEILITRNQYKIMIAKEPIESYGSFTVLKPRGSINFAIVFYQLPELYESLAAYIAESLNRQRKVPEHDAKKAAKLIAEIVKKTMGFEGDFQ